MKYKRDLKLHQLMTLIKNKSIEELESRSFAGNSVSTWKHPITGVLIKASETFEELDYLYAESDNSSKLSEFEKYILLEEVN